MKLPRVASPQPFIAIAAGSTARVPLLPAPPPEFRDLVAARAYFLWVEAGRPAGRDQEYWFTAELELRELPAFGGKS